MARAETAAIGRSGAAGAAALRLVAAWIVLPLFFLVTGGSLAWWEAWVCCAILLVPMTFFVAYIVRRDPEFMARRLKLHEEERTQRRILAWGYPAFAAEFIVPGLDYRFGWSEPPLAVVGLAMFISLAGYILVLRAFIENRWAGRTVETYAEQKVVSTGPYAIVRHPMYVGALALYLVLPVALGSWWAALPALAFVPVFVLRIRNEEEVLRRALPGTRRTSGQSATGSSRSSGDEFIQSAREDVPRR